VESTLWLVDLARASTTLIQTGAGRNDSPVWSPDATSLLFTSDRNGTQDFFVKRMADSTPEQPFYSSSALFKTPTDWSGPAHRILFHQIDPQTAYNEYEMPAEPNATPLLVAGGPRREVGGHFSPDGRWLRYLTEDTGRNEIIVQSTADATRRVQVSFNGAGSAWWSRDGRQVVYVGNEMRDLWRVDLEPTASGLRVGAPVRFGTLPGAIPMGAIDATPDLQRFLALLPDRSGDDSITVLQNWLAAVAKR
jgi:Tol biopolymer transport system component